MEVFEEVKAGAAGLGPVDEGVDFSLTLRPQGNPQLYKHLQWLGQVGQQSVQQTVISKNMALVFNPQLYTMKQAIISKNMALVFNP